MFGLLLLHVFVDIRHLTLHFMLPFLSYTLFLSGSKPMVIPLFANLKDDPALTVFRVLDAIWDAINVSPSAAVNRKASVALLHENSIDGIIKLYKRDGSDDEDDKVNEVTPAEMAHQFLLKTCTKPGVGVCFQDQGWYRRKGKGKADDLTQVEVELDEGEDRGTGKDGGTYGTKMLHNHILGNVVRRVGPRAVEEPKIAELVYSILGACPELVASFWPHSGISVDPRLSAKWLATMALLGHVISLPVPPNDSFHVFTGLTKADGTKETVAKANPPSLQVIIEAILPSPLTKQHLSKGLQHNVGLVQHETALTLARSLQKLLTVKATFAAISREMRLDMGGEQFDDTWSKCLRELEMETRKRVPEVPVIIAFAQKSAASQALQASLEEADEGEKAKANLLTEAALRLFRLYYRALPNMAAEFRFDVGKLLVSSSSAKQEAAARKMAREGSVIDDSGSVASFGTVGSAGMGGGFGQSRGDVTEFDALSQVHVLELLASVREWDWTAKAGECLNSISRELVPCLTRLPQPAIQPGLRIPTSIISFSCACQRRIFAP
jgi:nucleolar pre-ribosomal-associated protein 1